MSRVAGEVINVAAPSRASTTFASSSCVKRDTVAVTVAGKSYYASTAEFIYRGIMIVYSPSLELAPAQAEARRDSLSCGERGSYYVCYIVGRHAGVIWELRNEASLLLFRRGPAGAGSETRIAIAESKAPASARPSH